MNPFRSNIGTLNEILFKDKNKSYGAYALRNAYGNTVFKSLGITAAIMLGGVWILSILLGKEVEVSIPTIDDPNIKITVIDLPPQKLDQPPVTDEHQNNNNTNQNNNTAPIVTDHASDSIAVNNTITNPVVNNPGPGTGTTSAGTGSVVTNNTVTETNNEPVKFPEVFPDFPDIRSFWAKNIHYPTDARELGVEGKCAITFVVDEEGNVINCKIIKKLGFGCDEEVLRVAKLFPKWKPGTIGGKPVKVIMNQVIDFKLK